MIFNELNSSTFIQQCIHRVYLKNIQYLFFIHPFPHLPIIPPGMRFPLFLVYSPNIHFLRINMNLFSYPPLNKTRHRGLVHFIYCGALCTSAYGKPSQSLKINAQYFLVSRNFESFLLFSGCVNYAATGSLVMSFLPGSSYLQDTFPELRLLDQKTSA